MKRIIHFPKDPSLLTSMILIGLLTAFGSEIKITPFEEAPFRFGLGSIIFFLSILIKPVPIFKTGLITAVIVWLFRTGLDFSLMVHVGSIYEHLPAALFYIVFASGLQLVNVQQLRIHPFILGAYGALFETLGNVVEQLVITVFFTHQLLSPEEYLLLGAVAFLRSYFVMGLFSALALSEQKKQSEQLLSIGSDLYVKALYVQKSMDNIERITADGFALYQQLKAVDSSLSLKALMLAQEIHEVKKDSERIYAGLSKIISDKQMETQSIDELLRYVYEANIKYVQHLKKDIQLDIMHDHFHTNEPMLVLAIINNIVANAIEAIEQSGWIRIRVKLDDEIVIFTIENNGPIIPKKDLVVLMDPGYTTKFSASGYAATGIGLSHVQTIVQRLEGQIDITSNRTTIFKITIPTYKLL